MSTQPLEEDMVEQSLDSAREMEGKYLTFWTDKQLFGVPIADVVQIVGMQKITPMPESLPYAKGIINLRGDIIPTIDVRLRFGKPEAPYDERTCIIITSIHDTQIGFIVDEVNEVADIAEQEISMPPRLRSDEVVNDYLTGIAQKNGAVILLMDTEKILSEDVVQAIADGV